MASVTVPFDSIPVRQVAARPWWRRGHTYAMPVVAGADVVLASLATWLAEEHFSSGQASELATSALLGFLFAKCFLLGLWAALGSPATVPRWLIVGGLATAGSIGVTWHVRSSDWSDTVGTLLQLVLFGWILTAGFALLLLPLRRLAGWRVDFDAAYHPSTGQRRGQIGLMDVAALMCAVALPLTLCRLLRQVDDQGDAADALAVIFVLGSLVALASAPLAYAALARRRAWAWLLAAGAWLIVLSCVHSLLGAYFPDLDTFSGPRTWFGFDFCTLAFYAGGAVAVAMPLLLLRPLGLKLLTVR
jgi:hypothetical protein